MLIMQIECGTFRAQQFDIDLDEYGIRSISPELNPVKQKSAYDLLRSTLNDYTFADDGYRNDDAVNSLIAVHVLGYDAEEWMKNFLNDMEGRTELFHSIDIERFEEHVERVLPYLSKWGPEGNREAALGYAITY